MPAHQRVRKQRPAPQRHQVATPARHHSAACLIGCSGWQYKHWGSDFYPADLPQSRWLPYYAQHFNAVEVNNTFYRLPEPSTFVRWRQRAPRGFVFAVKASRYLTHMKKLKDPADPIELFFSRAKGLGRTFGPVLYQLPPRWPLNLARFETFLQALPRGRRHAVEFREPSWYTDDVCTLLQRHRVALCLHDMQGSESGKRAVGPFVYVRFHGTQKYGGTYHDETLDGWAEWLTDQLRSDSDVYVYFNNDTGGHAPRDAVRLRGLIEARLGESVAGRRARG
jgi:uncharacterized protein YecE (DUF72 family)